MEKKRLVLAYSGGLDTSYCLMKLSKENYEVFALSHSRPSLDDVYLQATGKTLMDAELELAGKRDFKLENKKSMR